MVKADAIISESMNTYLKSENWPFKTGSTKVDDMKAMEPSRLLYMEIVCVPLFHYDKFLVKYILYPTTSFTLLFHCERFSTESCYFIVD